MRPLWFSAAIVGAGWVGIAPAMATSSGLAGLNGANVNATLVEKVGYWRRSTGVMATLHHMRTIRRRTATIRLPPHTHTLHLCMVTSRLRLRTPTLHPCMAIGHLRLPRMATIPPQKATTATIRPLRAATTVTTRQMAPKGWSHFPKGKGKRLRYQQPHLS